MTLKYLSLFSGVGGLEHPEIAPLLTCEVDPSCQEVLRKQYPDADSWATVETLSPPQAEMVVGGWPCQDLSAAGRLGGLSGARSGLFFEMLRVAKQSGASTVIGENVPNLLTLRKGSEFATVLEALTESGYPFISWRVLNARSFGLPQDRRRLFIAASKSRIAAEALHAALPEHPARADRAAPVAAGFYWTGGKRSVCFSPGFVPALKIGATDEKGRSPVAVLIGDRVRKLTIAENLRLQGLEHIDVSTLAKSAVLRMAGNAVPRPVGQFVVESVAGSAPFGGVRTGFGVIGRSGIYEDGVPWIVEHDPGHLATNLIDFLDLEVEDSLSAQAAAGLIVRSVRSGKQLPRELFEALVELSRDRSQRVHPSRGNSFAALDEMRETIEWYSRELPTVQDFVVRRPAAGGLSTLRTAS